MEITNKTFINYIYQSEDSKILLKQYFTKNFNDFEMFKNFEEISYLPNASKFIFLIKEFEKFILRNQTIINKQKNHLNSKIGLLFILEINTLSEFVLPLSFPNEEKFKYLISSFEDIICCIYIFIIVEIFKIINTILSVYLNENNCTNFEIFNHNEAFNDKEFIKIFPFLFNSNEKLKNYFENEIDKMEFENPFDNRFQIIINKFKASFRELPEQINSNYSRYFNYLELRKNFWDYENDDISLQTTLNDFKHKENGIITYVIPNDFILPNIEFMNSFGKQIIIDEVAFYDFFYAKNIQISDKEKIESLQNSFDNLESSIKFKKYLKIKTDKEFTTSLFYSFIDIVFKIKNNNEKSQIKKDFAEFINFFLENKVSSLPIIKNLSEEDLKQILLFFSYFKKSVFDYTDSKLIELIFSVTNNSNKKVETYRKFINRNKLILDKKEIKKLEESVPYEFRPSNVIC